MVSTQNSFTEEELALILESIRYQRHSAEDDKKKLKEFISFCKDIEKKVEELLGR